MSEIQPYGTTQVCVKCGCKRFVKEYCPGRIDEYGTYIEDEHLKWTCADCLYEWKTQTKDKR